MGCVRIFLVLILTLSLTGCVTTKKKVSTQDFSSRLDNLEMQIQQQENELWSLKQELAKTKAESEATKIQPKETKKIQGSIKPTPKEIQIALKNAGYYDGSIDGKIGNKTQEAIKAFQAANDLNADGVVGQKTWSKLKEYFVE